MIGLLARIGGFKFLPHVSLGLSLALLLAIGGAYVQGQRMHVAKVERDAAIGREKATKHSLKVSEISVATLTAALEVKNEESRIRAKAFADAQAADRANIAKTQAQSTALRQRVSSLLGMVSKFPDPICPVNDDLIAALEGL